MQPRSFPNRRGSGGEGVKIPNAARVLISREKLRDYVLSLEHPVGGAKALWLARLGYTRAGWRTLREDIREHLKRHAPTAVQTEIGTKFAAVGPVHTPFRPTVGAVSVWVVA